MGRCLAALWSPFLRVNSLSFFAEAVGLFGVLRTVSCVVCCVLSFTVLCERLGACFLRLALVFSADRLRFLVPLVLVSDCVCACACSRGVFVLAVLAVFVLLDVLVAVLAFMADWAICSSRKSSGFVASSPCLFSSLSRANAESLMSDFTSFSV